MNELHQVSAYTDVARFSALRARAGQNAELAVSEVAKEFEALFVEIMLKSAREASMDSGLFQSQELKLYREMFDSQIALAISNQGSLGFDKVIARSLGITDAGVSNAAESQIDGKLSIPKLSSHGSTPGDFLSIPPPPIPPSAPEPAVTSSANTLDKAQRIQNASPELNGSLAPELRTEEFSGEQREFVEKITPYAIRAASRLGTTPEILIAQAALETGWGQHMINRQQGGNSHNLFAIKAGKQWDGDVARVSTLEFYGKKPIKTTASFRSYPNFEAAFDDYVRLVQSNDRYQGARQSANNPESYIRELARAGYATDPNYANKIIAINAKLEALNGQAKHQIPTAPEIPEAH